MKKPEEAVDMRPKWLCVKDAISVTHSLMSQKQMFRTRCFPHLTIPISHKFCIWLDNITREQRNIRNFRSHFLNNFEARKNVLVLDEFV